MERHYLTTLSSKGQLTLPKPLREGLKLEEGQRLFLEKGHGGILIKKATFRTADDDLEEAEWEELKKRASPKGKTYQSGKAFLRSLKSR